MRRVFMPAAVLLAASLMALIVRGFVGHTLMPVLVYLWWGVRLYYDSLPQAIPWALVVLLTLLSSFDSLFPDQPAPPKKVAFVTPVRGQVESLALWLTKAPRGGYFKWLVAQRLGKLTRDLLTFRERRNPPSVREALGGSDWSPPKEVASYLEAGLNGSFADFPQPRWLFESPRPTPLDLNPREALEFIESNLEKK